MPWSRQDCEEFLDDLEREFKKVNKELDTYPSMDCEPKVKKGLADCRLRLEAYSETTMPGVMCPEKAGQGKGSRRPERNSEVPGMRGNLWIRRYRSALKACDWKGTAQVGRDRGRRGREACHEYACRL